MQSDKISKYNKDFLKVELEQFSQKGKVFYIAKVAAKDLLNLYTVEPAEYDFEKQSMLASSFDDDEAYYKYLINQERKRANSKEFQRQENSPRVKQISEFLNNEEYALFPNSIIVTCELINNMLNIGYDVAFNDLEDFGVDYSEINNISFFDKTNNSFILYVPYVQKSLLVIDGQHRLRGLAKAVETVTYDYDLLVTFIIDSDRTVLAELFYTINYTQKSVNKSLLYHLSGEFSRELNAITFLHETVKVLNEIEGSPFQKRIKMLGVMPSNILVEERKKLTISQSFLIDYFLPTISEGAKKSIHPPIFLHYFKNEKLQIEVIRFINKYFKAVAGIMGDEWNNPDLSIVSKTISVGALIRVLHFLFVKMFIDDFDSNFKRIKDISSDDFKNKLEGLKSVDFRNEGEFGKGTSAGGLNKLKKKMIEKITYFNASNYDSFLVEYKTKYLNNFKKKV